MEIARYFKFIAAFSDELTDDRNGRYFKRLL